MTIYETGFLPNRLLKYTSHSKQMFENLKDGKDLIRHQSYSKYNLFKNSPEVFYKSNLWLLDDATETTLYKKHW